MSKTETPALHRTQPEDKIRFSQLAAYGAGGIIPIALFNIAGILIGLMGNISLGLSAFWLGAIMIVPRMWDALSDPFIGHISDNTRTHWGRRRPFLLMGGISAAVFFVIIWWVPKGDLARAWFPSDTGFQWFQLSYILFTLLLFFTACNIFEIPHGALGMELTADCHERTRLFSAKSFTGNLFAMGTPWLFALANLEIFKGPGGNEADGMRYVSLIIAAILIPLAFWWTWTLREPGFVKAAKHAKTPFWQDIKRTGANRNFIMLTLTIFTVAMGFNFVQLLGSYIPIFYVCGGDKALGATLLGITGTAWAITGLLAVFPLNWISPKLGKRNTLAVAIFLMCAAQLSKIVCYNPRHPYLIIIPTMLLSAGMLFFFTLGASMVGDICDEDELHTGYRAEGSYYAIFWWFIKMGGALAGLVGGALIMFTAFDEVQVMKVDRIRGDVKELRAAVQQWEGYKGLATANPAWLANATTRDETALKESKEYLEYLQKELAKNFSEGIPNLPAYPSAMRNILLNSLSRTKATVGSLERLQGKLQSVRPKIRPSAIRSLVAQSIPLTLQTKLERARLHSFELEAHLEGKAANTKNSKKHYQEIVPTIVGIHKKLDALDASLPPSALDKELGSIETRISPLTKQTPYTLLMIRVVEIGLPLLLSIFSIAFLFQYSLTEERIHEIKGLMKEKKYKETDLAREIVFEGAEEAG